MEPEIVSVIKEAMFNAEQFHPKTWEPLGPDYLTRLRAVELRKKFQKKWPDNVVIAQNLFMPTQL
jgi:hypothetical protein